MDINKFVGIPHYFNESNYSKCDCIGLVRLFYREHDWIDITDGNPITDTWKDNVASRVMRWFKARFDVARVPSELEYGAVVVFMINGDMHFGIYIGYGKMLAMQVPVDYGKSRSTIYKREYWEPLFKIGFNRRA